LASKPQCISGGYGRYTFQPIYFNFIKPSSNLSYIAPQVVEACVLQKIRHTKSCLVQLATGTKRKVTKVMEACQFEMNGMNTHETLNILPLGSYDMLIGLDLLKAHQVKLDCFNITLECEDDKGNKRVLQGVQKPMSMRQIPSLQLKRYCRKGCSLYAIHVLDSVENKKLKI
jgi:hypothetical protein